jgi:hypothetical protein
MNRPIAYSGKRKSFVCEKGRRENRREEEGRIFYAIILEENPGWNNTFLDRHE